MSEDYDVHEKAAQATMKLQTARRDFDKLKKEEEEYLEDREMKAQALLKDVHGHIDNATEILNSITDKVVKKTEEFRKRLNTFAGSLFSLLDRAENYEEKLHKVVKKTQTLFDTLATRHKEADEVEAKLAEWNKDLITRERAVKLLNTDVDEKLREVTRLADWANSGERYNIKRN